MTVEATANLILQAPRPFNVPAAPSWRWLNVAVGQEMFGRRAGPWGIMFGPVPLLALALGLFTLFAPQALLGEFLTSRLAELAWLGWVSFVLAAAGQALVMRVSDIVWRLTEGQRHVDYSPRAWHYHVATAIALLPLVLLQVSDGVLDFYLSTSLWLQSTIGSMQSPHVGYSPGFMHHLLGLIRR